MHYYQRHLGDYSTATPHLSLLEHGAYTKLLDYYYTTESPIPDALCERIAGASSVPERKAVRYVLAQFFTLDGSEWRSKRADKEIAAFHAKSLKAKESAEARWMRTHSERTADAMLSVNHKPVSKKEQKQEPASPSGSRLPADWSLPDDWRSWAELERPDVDARREAAGFADYWHGIPGAKGRKADWQATWRNWIRRADGMRSRPAQQQQPGKRMQAIMRLEAMKNGLGNSGNHHGDSETILLGTGPGAGFGTGRGNGSGVG